MTRGEIIAELKKYFKVEELVCDHTYKKWKEASWQFLDTDYLNALLVIRRDILKKPMSCNTASLHQRGLRCNMCPEVKGKSSVYLSSHILGKAGDFSISGMTTEEARKAIKGGASLLPCNVRVEEGVSWLHFDVLPQNGISDKVYGFKA